MNKKVYVSMTDKFMSGWGMAEGKINKLVIECENIEQANLIFKNAQNRREMKYINICLNKPYYKNNVLVSLKKFSEMGGVWIR